MVERSSPTISSGIGMQRACGMMLA
jgi:hypothetical protein